MAPAKMTTSSGHYRRLLWILPIVILILAFYNILRSFEIRQLWTNKAKDPKYVSASFDIPGLGNLMYQYSSLVGIAAKSAHTVVLPMNLRLNQIFDIPELKWNVSRPGLEWGKVVELKHSSYDEIIDNLNFDHSIEIVGYLQSWKYFESYEKELRKRFTFQDYSRKKAESFLENVRASTKNSANPLYVGIHVRRGNFLSEQSVKAGYTVADEIYLDKAIKYYQQKYSKNSVIFIVASDDLAWCKQNLPSSKSKIFSEGNDDTTDMAILSHCNHTIMTVGTFGWWSAWLAGGDVIYFKDFPKTNSQLANTFSKTKEDYFPSHWIGM